ncbi:uncharacterized protein [Dysidea avara]
MFGTLVIQLPSNYEGGQLPVCHQGKEIEFNFGGFGACNNVYFAAFYADCQHEVKPVTKGHRLCLIYNLVYTGFDPAPAPPSNQKQISSIVAAMKAWDEDLDSDDCPNTLTQILEHQYCEASLSFQMLKNGDRALAEVLLQAKKEVEFDLYLSIVNFTECFSATYYGRGKYTIDDDGDGEVSASNLTTYDGEKLSSNIELEVDSMFPHNFFDDIDPDKEWVQEATGNEGATVDKHYHWAALLIWPVRKHNAVIGVLNMIEEFEREVKKGRADDDLTVAAKDIMKQLIGRCCWVETEVYHDFLQLLKLVGKSDLIAECLNVIAEKSSSLLLSFDDNNIVSSIGYKYGWDILKLPLESVFAKCDSFSIDRRCQFLMKFCSIQLSEQQKILFQSVAAVFVNYLVNEQESSWKKNRSKEIVCQLVSTLRSLECEGLLVSLIDAFCTKPVYYPVLETLGPAILDISKTVKIGGPLQVLFSHCASTLEECISKLQAPTNHARSVEFSCTCSDCTELKQFMQHPDITQSRFRLGKSRRQHLEDQLRIAKADATCQTERVGTPHTLVVTKTQASYEREVEKHKVHRELLASLQCLNAESEPLSKKLKLENDFSAACETISSTE